MSGGTGLLLLCEAELGKPMYEIPTGDSGAQEKAQERGAIATLGVGRTAPQGWTDGEFIREDLKGVSLPDVKKGLGDNKAAKATGYLMYNEYVYLLLQTSVLGSRFKSIVFFFFRFADSTKNRYIAYDVAQLRMRYLFRVGM